MRLEDFRIVTYGTIGVEIDKNRILNKGLADNVQFL
jgi:hypothetical protein